MITGLNLNTLNSSDITSAKTQQAAVALKASKGNAAAEKASKEFESVYVSEFLKNIFPKESDKLFGGKEGEDAFKSFLIDEYAKSVVNQGGFGIAKQVYNQLIKTQEARNAIR